MAIRAKTKSGSILMLFPVSFKDGAAIQQLNDDASSDDFRYFLDPEYDRL